MDIKSLAELNKRLMDETKEDFNEKIDKMKYDDMMMSMNDEIDKLNEQIKKMRRREAKFIFIFQEFQQHLSQYGQFELLKRLEDINEKYKY